MLKELSFLLPGNSQFFLQGVLENKLIPSFQGTFSLTSKQFPKMLPQSIKSDHLQENTPAIVKSDILLMPHILHLNNTQYASKEFVGLGNVIIYDYFPDDVQMHVSTSLDYINLDIFKLNEKFNDLLYL